MALAIRQNPRLTAAAREIVASQAGLRSARALSNPNFLFIPSLVGQGSDEEVLFAQPLELNGTRRARAGVARAGLRQARAGAVVELRNLVSQTKGAYFDLARARELRSLNEELLRTAEEFARITRRQAELGTRPEIDQTQTAIEVTRAAQQLTVAQRDERAATAALNSLMGRAPAEPIADLAPLAEGGGAAEPPPVDPEAITQQALAARAEIAAQRAAADVFRQEARLERAEGRPDLAPQLRAGAVTRGVKETGIGLGVNLPLIDYGARRNRIRQLQEGARAQDARVAAATNDVRREVDQGLTRLRAADAVVQQYQQGVLAQARRLLEAARVGFQQGAYNVVQLLEAQRTYRAVLTEYANALAAQSEARAELERATGAVPADLLPGGRE